MCPTLETNVSTELLVDPYERFIRHHLQYYGYFKGQNKAWKQHIISSQDWRDPKATSIHKKSSMTQDSFQEENKLIYSLLLETSLFGSKQIVFDQQKGQYIPRLREPRGLFATPFLHGSLQAPRWPIECEVVHDVIYHLEWVPLKAEEFYQPTGKERKPQIVGEENGTVVYQINPATKGSYFTCSQIGGRRGPIKSSTVMLWKQEDSVLQFESRFESGNLQKAVRVGPYEYELTLRTDLYTSKHTQWFYFQVRNTKKDIQYRFTIINLMKSTSLYSMGMKPLLYSQKDAQLRNIGWRREGNDISYYKNTSSQEGSFYCLTWTFQLLYDNDTCYFAHCYPYTYSDLNHYLLSMANDPILSQFCKLRALCRSLAGNTVYLLTITSPSQNHKTSPSKKAVVVTARVHPGETTGSWMMKGFLDFILSDSPDARLLRDMFIFKVVPMLNPDGVIVGNYRCSLAGRDLNRNYSTILKDSFPCVWYTKAMINRLLEKHEVLLYCDFHGHSRKNNIFMYGCSNENHSMQHLHERVFPLMLSKNASDKFSFQSCKFRVQKHKEGTGRIVMWRMGIQNSYTLESTFGGSTLGNKKGTHFNTEDLKSMGLHLCDTLLDYCDPDSSKVTHCLLELQKLLRENICRKLQNTERDLDSDMCLNDISLSDIESSTSGSNSSESDGPPANLLQISEKLKKRKCLKTRKERNKLLLNQKFQKPKSPEEKMVQKRLSFSEIIQEPVLPDRGAIQLSLIKNCRKKDTQLEEPEKGGEPLKTIKDLMQEKPLQHSSEPNFDYLNMKITTDLPVQHQNEISWDKILSHHFPVAPRLQNIEQRHPLIIKTVQHAQFPAVNKKAVAVIKQHPGPFDPLLHEELNRRQTFKKEKALPVQQHPFTDTKQYRVIIPRTNTQFTKGE
ncbi:cytosolic carboxypeptidase 2 [Microcaecilia unicolor]|uniref:Cytosolic carboxypeptidase 2 n=1 Tax=Microcaecilia unicolor TaxID=1415580 RepID=A0A6P7XS77_9AMPH|nr:cytosolic carboxypeptidase 2 [Microcaecilia unicolor]